MLSSWVSTLLPRHLFSRPSTPQVSVANYYGDIVQKGETTDNPGTDTGGWDDGDTEQQIFFGDSEMDGFG